MTDQTLDSEQLEDLLRGRTIDVQTSDPRGMCLRLDADALADLFDIVEDVRRDQDTEPLSE